MKNELLCGECMKTLIGDKEKVTTGDKFNIFDDIAC